MEEDQRGGMTPNAPITPPQVTPLRARRFRLPETFASLRHRNFQLYFGGQLVSVAGTWMQIIAQGWLVYQLSRSEIILGIVGFASAIPALLVSPWGGVVVDRVSKRNLLVATQTTAMLLAFTLAALTFTNKVQVWHIIALSALLGLVNSFDGPARQAFVVEMVGREDLPNAIALNSMMFNSARIIGPAMGGVLLATVGADWCFLINGFTFLAVIAGLLAMQLPALPRVEYISSPWTQLKSGLSYIYAHREMLALILLAVVFSIFGMSYTTLLPAFVEIVLKQGAAGYGTVNAASGIGAVTGAFMIANMGNRTPRGVWLTAANLAFPLILAVFAYEKIYPISLALSFGLGLGFMLQFTLINTLLQTRVEDQMRGRVLGLYTISFFGFAPFGNLAIGWAAQFFGLSPTIAVSAAIALVLSFIIQRWAPYLRQL